MGESSYKYNRVGILSVVMASLLWGIAGTFAQYLFTKGVMEPTGLMSIRMFFAGTLMIAYIFATQGSKALEPLRDPKVLIGMIAFGTLGLLSSQLTFYMAIKYSNAGTATVLQYLGPTLIAIYMCVVNRRLPGRVEMLAILLAVMGTFVVATHINLRSLTISKQTLFWGILSAFAMMTYTVMPGRMIERWGSMTVNAYAMFFGGTLSCLVFRPWTASIELSPENLGSIAVVVVLGTVVTYPLYLHGVRRIGPVAASTIVCLEPLSATICSAIFLKTKFVALDILGFALILSSVLVVSWNKMRL